MDEGYCENNGDSNPVFADRDAKAGVPQGEDTGECGCNEEFEFRVSVSRTQGALSPVDLSPADDLFYKGQLLPLHLPPRLEMVHILDTSTNSDLDCRSKEAKGENANSDLDGRSKEVKRENPNLSSVTSTSSSLDCIGNEGKRDSDESVNSLWSKNSNGFSDSSSSRDSSGSSQDSSECTSALKNREEKAHLLSWRKSAAKLKVSLLGQRKSSIIGVDEKALLSDASSARTEQQLPPKSILSQETSSSNRFPKSTSHSFSYSNDCKKHRGNRAPKEGFLKYLKMIKPLYEKISNKYDQISFLGKFRMDECENTSSAVEHTTESRQRSQTLSSSSSHVSLSGNLKIGTKKSGVGSCPPTRRSSPNHGGVIGARSDSTMEELQNAIQGAIAHCKKCNDNKSEAPSLKTYPASF